jgi:hypothetical protein
MRLSYQIEYIRKFLTEVTVNIAAFRNMTPCSLVLRATYCVQFQDRRREQHLVGSVHSSILKTEAPHCCES